MSTQKTDGNSPGQSRRTENPHQAISPLCPFAKFSTVLTTAFLIAVVGTVIQVVADFHHLEAVPVVTFELMRRACGFWGVAQVLQLIRFVPTVVLLITDKGLTNAVPILTGKLTVLAGRVGTAPLITVVATVVAPVTPV